MHRATQGSATGTSTGCYRRHRPVGGVAAGPADHSQPIAAGGCFLAQSHRALTRAAPLCGRSTLTMLKSPNTAKTARTSTMSSRSVLPPHAPNAPVQQRRRLRHCAQRLRRTVIAAPGRPSPSGAVYGFKLQRVADALPHRDSTSACATRSVVQTVSSQLRYRSAPPLDRPGD